jgi:predicted SAM-dependent methyltransferase
MKSCRFARVFYHIFPTVSKNIMQRLGKELQEKKKNHKYKLHIGCGHNRLHGWINIDMDENLKSDIVLDVTKGLPFQDNSISCIHSEDFIEHISLDDGKFFLKECFRVLKPDGVLRIVTPDLYSFVLGYMNRDPRALHGIRRLLDVGPLPKC